MKHTVNIGHKVNMLTFIREDIPLKNPQGYDYRMALCKCDCGNEKILSYFHFKKGNVLSCGCLWKTRNGYGASLLSKVWRQMINRCTNPLDLNAKRYLHRGITVCDLWLNDFESFRLWSLENGYKEKLHIDRIDNDKGYSPKNCRWVTPLVNQNNRRGNLIVKYKGKENTLSNMLRELGKYNSYDAIWQRIKTGWDIEEAIDNPVFAGGNQFNQNNKNRIFKSTKITNERLGIYNTPKPH